MRKTFPQRCVELLSHFSLRAQYRLGAIFAFFLRLIPNEINSQTRQNIALCFPSLEPAARQSLYRESLRQTCYALTELGAVWCWPGERILERVTHSEVCAEFADTSKGRIVLAPHLGSWETLVIWLGRQHDAIILYKRRKNRAFDIFIRQARERTGGSLVPTKKRGLRKLLVGLKQGACLMILPDQRPARNKARIESTFFGVDAPTTTLVQNLCSKVDCNVFIATIVRSSPPGEFSLKIEPLEHAQLAASDVDSAGYMNDEIERLARRHVEQYQWGYRRFDAGAYKSIE